MNNQFDAVPSTGKSENIVGTKLGYKDARAFCACLFVGVAGAILLGASLTAVNSIVHGGSTAGEAAKALGGFFFDKTCMVAAIGFGTAVGAMAGCVRMKFRGAMPEFK